MRSFVAVEGLFLVFSSVLIPLVVSSSAAGQCGTTIESCMTTSHLNRTQKGSNDEMWLYFSVMQSGMAFVVRSQASWIVQGLGDFLADQSMATLLSSLVVSNLSLIALLVILLLFSIGLLFNLFFTIYRRWFRFPDTGSNPSCKEKVNVLLLLSFSAILVFFGSLLFIGSLFHVSSRVVTLETKIETIQAEVGVYIDGFASYLLCAFCVNANSLPTAAKINSGFGRIKEDFGTHLNFSIVEDIKQEMNQRSIMTPQHQSIFDKIINLQPVGDTAIGHIVKLDSLTQTVLDKVQTSMREQGVAFNTLYSDIRVTFDKLFDRVHDLISSESLTSNVVFFSELVMIFPLILLGLLILAIVLLLVRFVCSRKKTSETEKREEDGNVKRGWPSKIAGYLLGFGGYVAMVLAFGFFTISIPMVMVAYGTQVVCVGLFEDPDIQVLSVIPMLEKSVEIGPNQFLNISLHDILLKCRNGYPFLDSAGGEMKLSDGIISQHMGGFEQEMLKAIETIEKAFDFDNGISTQTAQFYADFKNDPTLGPKFESLHYQMSLLESELYMEFMRLELLDEFNNVKQTIVESGGQFIKDALDLSPQCDQLMTIFRNVGDNVCLEMSQPVQGFWFACVLCGLCGMIVYRYMFKTTRYLYDFSRDDPETVMASPKRSKNRGSVE